MNLLALENIRKEFVSGSETVHVLRGVSLSLEPGDTVAITGPSGSGKSTMLGLMAGLDRPTSGRVLYQGAPIHEWSEDRLAEWRRRSVGFIFQSFRLVPSLTARENVALPLELLGWGAREAAERAETLLARLDLPGRAGHFPRQLSGGEQQRVAIARAYVHEPSLIFADEPTGSVDREHAELILNALLALNAERATALVLVTHDPAVAARLKRTAVLERGALASSAP